MVERDWTAIFRRVKSKPIFIKMVDHHQLYLKIVKEYQLIEMLAEILMI